ncbi:heme ABC transporter ATP-binding protein [Marinibacterium sp. SX1]|uniref:heme ABC transporter ATP-binding protein n=1 Tax=Marinibacterium sp. SX1 TaxID=3388424 RepID=UPI003D179078
MIGKNIRVTLGRREILHGLDFEARDGRVTAIVGPNGSGKSTLLKAMTGEIPATGDMSLNGRDIDAMQPWELASVRAVQSQSTTVAFPFTVIEVVRLGHSAGPWAAEPGIPEAALSRLGLDGYAHRYYHELSGGEQQRAQLARVLAQVWHPVQAFQPSWVFLDEPVSSLDIGHQFVVMDLLADYARQGGGVITVMHDLNLTAIYADHVVLMKDGQVLARGTPAEVLTDERLSQAYDHPLRVNRPAPSGVPYLLPQACRDAS